MSLVSIMRESGIHYASADDDHASAGRRRSCLRRPRHIMPRPAEAYYASAGRGMVHSSRSRSGHVGRCRTGTGTPGIGTELVPFQGLVVTVNK